MTLEDFTVLFAEFCLLVTVLTIGYFYRVAEPEDKAMMKREKEAEDWKEDVRWFSNYEKYNN